MARRFGRDERGTMTLEYALLLAVIGIPLIAIFAVALDLMVSHYQMTTFLNGWPFP